MIRSNIRLLMGVSKKGIGVAARFLAWLNRMLVPGIGVQNSQRRQVREKTALVLDTTNSEIFRKINRKVSVDNLE